MTRSYNWNSTRRPRGDQPTDLNLGLCSYLGPFSSFEKTFENFLTRFLKIFPSNLGYTGPRILADSCKGFDIKEENANYVAEKKDFFDIGSAFGFGCGNLVCLCGNWG